VNVSTDRSGLNEPLPCVSLASTIEWLTDTHSSFEIPFSLNSHRLFPLFTIILLRSGRLSGQLFLLFQSRLARSSQQTAEHCRR
jgi:hypothetical protein